MPLDARAADSPRNLSDLRQRGVSPGGIIVDEGPDFAGRVVEQWVYNHGVALHFIPPATPRENSFVEKLNGKSLDWTRDGGTSIRHTPSRRPALGLSS